MIGPVRWSYVAIAGAAGLLAGWFGGGLWDDRHAAEARAEARVYAAQAKAWRDSTLMMDRVVYADTVRLRETLTRWRVARGKVDTLTLPPGLDTLVIGTDSVVRACSAAIESLGDLCAARAAENTALRRQIAALERGMKPRRVLPYAETYWSPTAPAWTARAGVEVRAFGPVRLTAGGEQAITKGEHLRAFVGARLTF